MNRPVSIHLLSAAESAWQLTAPAITGTSGNDSLTGTAGDDTLDGGAGKDTMSGGLGNDTYIVDNSNDKVVENPGSGTDSVFSSIAYTLTAEVENLTLTGTANLKGTGNSLNNLITGNTGNNTLDGLIGADTLIGGLGNDTYIVDDAGDVVNENAGEGTDSVKASVSFTLGENIEKLTLTGSANLDGTGNALANALTGNTGNNLLSGSDGKDNLSGDAGDDTLDGGTGDDKLTGGAGNDIYYVDSAKDTLVENAAEGTDSVFSSLSNTLAANIENLTLTGSADLKGTGNSLNNLITGNAGNNSLLGGDGNDTLDGGIGSDTLDGGAGNDFFWLAQGSSDTLVLGAGNDTVQGSLGNHHYQLEGGGVDVISLSGGSGQLPTTEVFTLTNHSSLVNDLKVDLTASNTLVLNFANGDQVTLTNTAIANQANLNFVFSNTSLSYLDMFHLVYGSAGDDTLVGASSRDTMFGSLGNDTYMVDAVGDLTIENPGEGIDTVIASVSYTLLAEVENLTLLGTANLDGKGNDLANSLIGNSGNTNLTGAGGNDTLIGGAGDDTLDGGVGNDSMMGGAGNDTYIVNSEMDAVIEDGEGGVDAVQASVNFTMDSELENLTLVGVDSLTGAGNAQANIMQGNDGNNVLYGGAGNDLINGGAGVDNLYGDEGNDTLLGGDGVDYLWGGTGSDSLNGGAGNDYLFVDDQMVGSIDGGAGSDYLTAYCSASTIGLNLTLGASVPGSWQVTNVETLELHLGSGADYLSVGATKTKVYADAGAGNDTLLGGSSDDELGGGEGNDTILGGGGNDFLSGGGGNNALNGEGGNDEIDISGDFADTIDGGSGHDSLVGLFSGSTVGLNLTLGSTVAGSWQVTNIEEAWFHLGSGADYLSAGGKATSMSVNSGAGNDTLLGGSSSDDLCAGEGNDLLSGGGGDDYLEVGDQVADTIDGGDGFDSVTIDCEVGNIAVNMTLGSQVAGGWQVTNVEYLNVRLGGGADFVSAGGGATQIAFSGGDGNDTVIGGMGYDRFGLGAGSDTLVLISPTSANWASDLVEDFASGVDTILFSAGSLPLGDGDTLLEGAMMRSAAGGFATSAELVVFSSNISGSISADAAATKIGSATSAYAVGQTALFVVDNGSDTAVYYFKSAGNDALVSASELTLLATLSGTSATTVEDYVLGA